MRGSTPMACAAFSAYGQIALTNASGLVRRRVGTEEDGALRATGSVAISASGTCSPVGFAPAAATEVEARFSALINGAMRRS